MTTEFTSYCCTVVSKYTIPFSIDNTTLIAPLITARYTPGNESVFVRIVAFIPVGKVISNLLDPPIFEGPTLKFNGITKNRLDCEVNFKEVDLSSTEFTVYYIEFEYFEDVDQILEVGVILNDEDPVTSRGTVTTVQTC